MPALDDNSIKEINAKLKNIIAALMPKAGSYPTGIAGLKISRRDKPNIIERCFYKPMIILLLQGNKHSIIGTQKIDYGAHTCMLTGANIPGANYLTGISARRPMLSISLEINPQVITQLLAQMPPIKNAEDPLKGLSVAPADPCVMDAFLRLANLIDKPSQQPILAPIIAQEIHYRVLAGPQGKHLKSIYTLGTQSNKITSAITWLIKNFQKPLLVDDLAKKVNMAPSTFFRIFKDITTLSPLQYQKRLRLYEAHRLMLEESKNATSAGYQVGYESQTQFNREYKRMFGTPPSTSIKTILNA